MCRALKLITLNFAIDIQQIPTSLLELRLADQSRKPIGNDVAKADVLRKYKDFFEGVGCFEGEYHVTLNATVPPVVQSPRCIQVALRDSLANELHKLEKQSIIAKVDKPTDRVNSVACTAKPEVVYDCLDNILPKLNGAKNNFSILRVVTGKLNLMRKVHNTLPPTYLLAGTGFCICHLVTCVLKMFSRRESTRRLASFLMLQI